MNSGPNGGMPTDITHEKQQQVHELIDGLAPSHVTAVRGFAGNDAQSSCSLDFKRSGR
jgi:hypothetical protein